MTIFGIDRSSARAILAELGSDTGMFAARRHCAAWAGLCPGNHQSAGKRRHGGTRRGSLTLREVLTARKPTLPTFSRGISLISGAR